MTKFGILDYLQINATNQSDTLIPNTHKEWNDYDDSVMRIHRDGQELINEYFAYQVLTALGMPAPRVTMSRNHRSEGELIALDTIRIHEVKCNELNDTVRKHPSLFLGIVAEMVTMDKDGFQHFRTLLRGRYYRFNYDREFAQPELTNVESLAIHDKQLQNQVLPEQIVAFIQHLEMLINENVLHKIMQNSRVRATPEFMEHAQHIQALQTAWAKNLVMIVSFFKERYKPYFEGFTEREQIREMIAAKVISHLKLPEGYQQEYKQNFMHDLRAGIYGNPAILKPECLEDAEFINKVKKTEQSRLALIQEQAAREVITRIIYQVTGYSPNNNAVYNLLGLESPHVYTTPLVQQLASADAIVAGEEVDDKTIAQMSQFVSQKHQEMIQRLAGLTSLQVAEKILAYNRQITQLGLSATQYKIILERAKVLVEEKFQERGVTFPLLKPELFISSLHGLWGYLNGFLETFAQTCRTLSVNEEKPKAKRKKAETKQETPPRKSQRLSEKKEEVGKREAKPVCHTYDNTIKLNLALLAMNDVCGTEERHVKKQRKQ